MRVMNHIDRFHLVGVGIDRAAELGMHAAYAKRSIRDRLIVCGPATTSAAGNGSRVPGTTEADNV